MFKRIYEPWWGPRTDDIMRAVCLTLTSIPGATLTEVPLLLSHEGWHREVRTRLDHSPGLSAFWLWYERLGEQQRAAMVAPLMNLVGARGPPDSELLLSRLYHSEKHDPLLFRETFVTTDHYLDYHIHLEWERRIKEWLL